jgi:hypothetical protein
MPNIEHIKTVYAYLKEDRDTKISTICNKENINYYTVLRCFEIIEFFEHEFLDGELMGWGKPNQDKSVTSGTSESPEDS